MLIHMKTCPNCKTRQPYDALFGYQNKYCPEFCKLTMPLFKEEDDKKN
jgi:hypothetical protein